MRYYTISWSWSSDPSEVLAQAVHSSQIKMLGFTHSYILMAKTHQWKEDKPFEEDIITFQTSNRRLRKDIYFQGFCNVQYNLMPLYGFGYSKHISLSRVASLEYRSIKFRTCGEVLMTTISRQFWSLVLFAGLVLNAYPQFIKYPHNTLPKQFVSFTSTYSVK